jgi:hypothetical protein
MPIDHTPFEQTPYERTPFEQTLHASPRAFQLDLLVPWIAVAAVGIGLVGVAREMTRRRMACDPLRGRLVTDRHEFTPPHGDKLLHQTHGVV